MFVRSDKGDDCFADGDKSESLGPFSIGGDDPFKVGDTNDDGSVDDIDDVGDVGGVGNGIPAISAYFSLRSSIPLTRSFVSTAETTVFSIAESGFFSGVSSWQRSGAGDTTSSVVGGHSTGTGMNFITPSVYVPSSGCSNKTLLLYSWRL